MFASGKTNAVANRTANYIEDVFSTYLYTGNNTLQAITNGIDLAGKGGLVWTKYRSGTPSVTNHVLTDTIRGAGKYLSTNNTSSNATFGIGLSSFNSNGFTLATGDASNNASVTYASWTFREQPKFFDVVTYTGNGVSGRTISHSLGSTPGCVIVKCTNGAGTQWIVHHRSLTSGYNIFLNSTAAGTSYPEGIQSTASTTFTIGSDSDVNLSGATYVAYIFAHNAGGFGLTGTDNVISCGSISIDPVGTAVTVNLGYEPQWLLIKRSDSATNGNWRIIDNMRRFDVENTNFDLYPNLSNAETTGVSARATVNSTGFKWSPDNASSTYIYIAIRRGPMKVPTSGTSVLGLSARTGTNANATVTGGQTADVALIKVRDTNIAGSPFWATRLTGTGYLASSSTAAEVAAGVTILQANPWDVMDGIKVGTTSTITNASANTYINYLFRRAPSFFDEVCYTGTGSNPRNITHNLTVIPELIIVKGRNSAGGWSVYSSAIGNTKSLLLSSASASFTSSAWNNTTPTSSVFTTGSADTNELSTTYVAYLFATCAGVSKVGSYTGTGTTLQIDCGFSGGARFVLIKRTDAVANWFVWDTARGIVSGNDPYFALNSTSAEVTGADYIDPYSAGFEISSTAAAAINASGGTYIYLAIA